MKIEHKKLIAREILWFVGILFGIFVFIAIMGGDLFGLLEGASKDWFLILKVVVFLYVLRAIGWAIKISFFTKKH